MIRNIILNFLFSTIAVFMVGCSTTGSKTARVPGYMFDDNYMSEIMEFDYNNNIKSLLSSVNGYEGSRAGGDCSGFVSLLNEKNGGIFFSPSDVDAHMTSSRKSEGIYNLYSANGDISYKDPRPGDLIFFYNTTSNTKNSSKKHITHLGVIKDVYANGRISFVHHSSGKNIVSYMNTLKKNTFQSKDGVVENSYLVRCRGGDTSCLASNRFAGFGMVAR
ncbi:MAG: C40 family peptidase [Campylobacter sp.]|nr:C40 family peptidase [Campylobacter sp.]